VFLLHMHIQGRAGLVDESAAAFLNSVIVVRQLVVAVSGVVFVVVVQAESRFGAIV
jgi:hypothetical protein